MSKDALFALALVALLCAIAACAARTGGQIVAMHDARVYTCAKYPKLQTDFCVEVRRSIRQLGAKL